MAVIKAPIHWTKLAEPDTKYTPSWQVQVELTPEQMAKINAESKIIFKKAKGIKFFPIPDSKNVMWRLSRPVVMSNGEDNEGVKVVDRKNVPYSDLQKRQIGNGTIANIMYFSMEYSRNGGGVMHGLVGIQVVELIKYEAAEEFSVIVDDDTPSAETGESFEAQPAGKSDDY